MRTAPSALPAARRWLSGAQARLRHRRGTAREEGLHVRRVIVPHGDSAALAGVRQIFPSGLTATL